MNKQMYEKPSMTVAEFCTQNLVLCGSSFSSVPFGSVNGGFGSAWGPDVLTF